MGRAGGVVDRFCKNAEMPIDGRNGQRLPDNCYPNFEGGIGFVWFCFEAKVFRKTAMWVFSSHDACDLNPIPSNNRCLNLPCIPIPLLVTNSARCTTFEPCCLVTNDANMNRSTGLVALELGAMCGGADAGHRRHTGK